MGRAKRCERLPLQGFKKPPLAVGELPRTTSQQTEPVTCQVCSLNPDNVSQGPPFLALISEASLTLEKNKGQDKNRSFYQLTWGSGCWFYRKTKCYQGNVSPHALVHVTLERVSTTYWGSGRPQS